MGGLAMGLAASAVNGGLITKGRMNPVITTLATISVFSGLAYLVTKGQAVGVSNDTFNSIGNGRGRRYPHPRHHPGGGGRDDDCLPDPNRYRP